MRKAQIQSQVFVFIFAAVLMGLIFFFGWKWFNQLNDSRREVMFLEFKDDLKAALESKRYGDRDEVRLKLPGTAKELCFVDLDKDVTATTWPASQGHSLMKDSVESGQQINAFLVTSKTVPLDYVGKVTVSNAGLMFLCITANANTVTFWLEGKGDHVEVSPTT
ncbi:MAG: hypothetical protein V1735_05065 [Nanoarchaeota archaeon]